MSPIGIGAGVAAVLALAGIAVAIAKKTSAKAPTPQGGNGLPNVPSDEFQDTQSAQGAQVGYSGGSNASSNTFGPAPITPPAVGVSPAAQRPVLSADQTRALSYRQILDPNRGIQAPRTLSPSGVPSKGINPFAFGGNL